MRIAVLVDSFPALSETFVLDQVAGLLDRGHEVEIFSRGRSRDPIAHPAVAEYDLNRRVHVLDIPVRNRLRYLTAAMTAAFRVARRSPRVVLNSMNCFKYPDWDAIFLLAKSYDRKYDVVVAQFGPNGEIAARLKEAGVSWPVLTVFHGYDIRWANERGARIYDALFRVGDRFLGVSQEICDRLRLLGADASRIAELPSGIDVGMFCRDPASHEWSPEQTVVLLTVARLHPVKGLAHGLEAFRLVRERRPDIRLEYRLVGLGPQEAELRELAARLAIDQQVHFLGGATREEVVAQYRRAQMFVSPSIAEGLPTSLREAMACELPVVATSVGGTREFVRDGENGILVPPGNPMALADGILQLLETPSAWRAMGSRARESIVSKYELTAITRELERMCLQVVDHTTSVECASDA